MAPALAMDPFTLLGVDWEKGLIAYRTVDSGDSDFDMGVAECDYAGVGPTDEVVLHLGRVDGAIASWTGYAHAYDPSECTPAAVSKKRLADAKAAFAKAGVSIDTPHPLVSLPEEGGSFIADCDGVVGRAQLERQVAGPARVDDWLRPTNPVNSRCAARRRRPIGSCG